MKLDTKISKDTKTWETLHDIKYEAFQESIKPKSLFTHTWFAGGVIFVVSLIAMTIDNL